MYYKYPEGKIVTKIPIVEEVEPSEEFEKEKRLVLEAVFNGNEKKDVIWKEKDEDEEEENEQYLMESKDIFFFWHFTTAAICLVLSSVFFILEFFFYKLFPLQERTFTRSDLYSLLLLLLLPLLLPAVRMDEFTKVTYWVFFIPAIISMVALLVLVFVLQTKQIDLFKYNSAHYCCIWRVTFPLTYLLVLGGFILFVMRIDKTLPSSMLVFDRYTVILLFPVLGVLLLVFVWACSNYHRYRDDCKIFFMPIASFVVYGGFLLPFCLRKDGVFTTSYHYVMIPWYIAGAFVCIYIVVVTLTITAEKRYRTFWELQFNRRRVEGTFENNFNSDLLRAVLLGKRKLDDVTLDGLLGC